MECLLWAGHRARLGCLRTLSDSKALTVLGVMTQLVGSSRSLYLLHLPSYLWITLGLPAGLRAEGSLMLTDDHDIVPGCLSVISSTRTGEFLYYLHWICSYKCYAGVTHHYCHWQRNWIVQIEGRWVKIKFTCRLCNYTGLILKYWMFKKGKACYAPKVI